MAHTDDEERRVARQTAEEISYEEHFDKVVVPLRKQLFANVDLVTMDLEQALKKLNELKVSKVYDVEYEGTTRFEKYLREAHRMAVIAKALMPTDERGGTDRDPRLTETVKAFMDGSHLS